MSVNLSEITAVVPVRAGSRRLPNKNLAPFCGNSLLQHKLIQLKSFLNDENILVSSDSEEMLDVARDNGVQMHRRPSVYADDVEGKPLGETIAHIAEQVTTQHILWSQVTSPMVEPNNYISAAGIYLDGVGKSHDSLISVNRVRDYLRDHKGPLNYDTGRGHVPSQFLPELWRVTYGIVMAPKNSMIRWGYYYGTSPYLFELSKYDSVDIDDGQDLLVAEAMYRSLRLDKPRGSE